MKGLGIRNRLITSFLLVIASLVIFCAFLFLTQIILIERYQAITDNMITEYQVATTVDNLVGLFNETVKSVQDPQQVATYNAVIDQINAIFSKLNTTIVDQQSQTAYIGLRNTVQNLISGLNTGIQQAQAGNISDTDTEYNNALQEEDFVQQNTATLIFDQLNYTEQVQTGIARDEFITEIFGALLLLLLGAGAVIYAFFFSKKLTAPLIDLAKLAKNIAGGNLDATVDPALLATTNEVGSLANSFNVMVQSLRKNINELDTEKKMVEEKVKMRTRELVEERARLLASINSLPLGFILLDTKGDVLLLNHQAQELFPQKETNFSSLGKLFIPAIDVNALHALTVQKQGYELREAKLGERSFHVTATPVILSRSDLNQEDEIIGSVVLMEDITHEKEVEHSKDTFLAIAAHEMRTPLTIIRGNAELLLEEPSIIASSPLMAQIKSVLNGAVRLLGIVNDFLDVQNLEGGVVNLKIEAVDAVAVLRDVAKDLMPSIEKKGLTLTLEVPPDPIILPLDKSRYQQICINLISNAIHYTDRGGITVVLQREEKNITILFKDTGIGIDKEEQGRLFKKFETGRVFLRSKEYGSGLGLYISRFLAHLMKGDLVLQESAVNKGSIFCLTLPVGPAH